MLNTSGDQNAFFGTATGLNNTDGNENTFIGYRVGLNNTTGSFNTYLGKDAGFSNVTGSGNVLLGYNAGYFELGSDKLYIDNSNTDSPLIYGEFDNNLIRIHGDLEVTGQIIGLDTSGTQAMLGVNIDSTNTFVGLEAG